MKFKKFIKEIKIIINIEDENKENKKVALKSFIKKLNKKKNKLKKSIDKESNKDIIEDLKIVKYHIKKGKKILCKLYKKEK